MTWLLRACVVASGMAAVADVVHLALWPAEWRLAATGFAFAMLSLALAWWRRRIASTLAAHKRSEEGLR